MCSLSSNRANAGGKLLGRDDRQSGVPLNIPKATGASREGEVGAEADAVVDAEDNAEDEQDPANNAALLLPTT